MTGKAGRSAAAERCNKGTSQSAPWPLNSDEFKFQSGLETSDYLHGSSIRIFRMRLLSNCPNFGATVDHKNRDLIALRERASILFKTQKRIISSLDFCSWRQSSEQ